MHPPHPDEPLLPTQPQHPVSPPAWTTRGGASPQPEPSPALHWPKALEFLSPQSRIVLLILASVVLLCGLCGTCAVAANALGGGGQQATVVAPATSSVSSKQAADAQRTSTLALPSTTSPVTAPTATATPKPTATAQPNPKPTATPKPTCPYPAVNGNPWCYNWTHGSTISSPPSAFCSYFAYIASFWSGKGYVIQCQDGKFSKSGGRQGSCSHHGGDKRTLLKP